MITVRISRHGTRIRKVVVGGHGSSTPDGERVCAAVSSAVAMLRRTIGGTPIDEEHGGSYSVDVPSEDRAQWVTSAFVAVMETIEAHQEQWSLVVESEELCQ